MADRVKIRAPGAGHSDGRRTPSEPVVDSQRPVKRREPILVTGMHRSGTSWVGHMLCAGGDFIHLPEPLNVLNRQTILPSRVEQWYTYISDRNEEIYLPHYRDAMAFRLHPLQSIRNARLGSPRDPFRITKRWMSFPLGRIQGRRLLIRDPFAVLSSDWFARRLGFRVVVVVRHPLAVIGSLKRLGYVFDFKNLLTQPLLMDERLGPFRSEMEAMARARTDIVDQGCLLWRVVYDCVAATQARDASVCVVRHEDLSLTPVEGFGRLHELLGLSFGDRARRTVDQHTREANPKEGSKRNPFKVSLDSRANLRNWRHRLSDEEVDRILETTRPVADRFYPNGGADVLKSFGGIRQ
jgi:Sulfotransferase domain